MMYAGLLVVIFRGFYLVGGIEKAFEIANSQGRIQFFNVGIDPYSTNNLWNCVLGMGMCYFKFKLIELQQLFLFFKKRINVDGQLLYDANGSC